MLKFYFNFFQLTLFYFTCKLLVLLLERLNKKKSQLEFKKENNAGWIMGVVKEDISYLTGLLVSKTFRDLNISSLSSPCNSGLFNFSRNAAGWSDPTSICSVKKKWTVTKLAFELDHRNLHFRNVPYFVSIQLHSQHGLFLFHALLP